MTESDGDTINVRAFAVFDDGTGPALHAGGIFTVAGGVSANGIAKWDGSMWSPVGGGVTGFARIYALLVFDDGSGPALYAAGSFTTAGSVKANAVAKWDGASWSALGGGLTDGWPHTIVYALAIYDDGTGPALYAGGRFAKADGQTAKAVAKWTGTEWVSVNAMMNGKVNALFAYDAGTGSALYAGGLFNTAGGQPLVGIAKWDGTSWSDVGGGVSGANPYVRAMTVYDDGNGSALYAGGNFAQAGQVPAKKIARWDGAEWSPLGEGFGGSNPWVTSLITFDDGSGLALYTGGKFTLSGETVVNRVARWTGSTWAPLGNGTNDNVYSLGVFDEGDGPALYVGGRFTGAGEDLPASRIVRWLCPRALPGDYDGDGDVDLWDYDQFQRCFGGPGGEVPPECGVFDFDEDLDVDFNDFGGFQAAFTG
jgi:hypothetical protein